MLKALELVGFKSFADKTRFEFPRGITAVVGPNGSGKSNVVDAIKWVLGEQSVKSLRGKEMADVIFNGSGSRHALNAAEATLTFDNSARLLPIDTAEIHVTRRVYRSGEGEYLINRQPCRLRDIRDLCTGTGVATEAYSVIEQGKVDIMLQASPRDRRAIFEEAAGISRFKAKKIESLRRLERVEQNLLRLSDIVDEVENRLRAVRLQASKARRYKEHTDRLQELRTQVGLADWRKLSKKIDLLEQELATLSLDRDSAAAQAERIEARALELETALSDASECIRASESRLAELRERIATLESTLEHQRSRARDAEEEVARHQRQWAAMNVRAGDLAQQLAETTQAVAEAERQFLERSERLADDQRDLSGLQSQLEASRAAHEKRRAAWLESMRLASAQATELASLQRGAEAAEAARLRSRQRLDELDETRQTLEVERERLQRAQQEQARVVDQQGAQWSAARRNLADLRDKQSASIEELASLKQRHSALAERASLLEELEQRQEGLGAGVKQMLAEARSAGPGSPRGVLGVVAELFHVNVDQAPLVEVALGEKAQFIVLEDGQAWDALVQRDRGQLLGRVGFIRLTETPTSWETERNLEGLPGVVGRADHAVDTSSSLAALARRLLGGVWIVETLEHALELSTGAGRGLAFVTLAGELLEADGSLSAGPRHASIGLISRRSELRALKVRLAELADTIGLASEAAEQLEREIAAESQRAQDLAEAHQRAADALGEQRLRVQAVETRQGQLGEQRDELVMELAAAERDCQRLTAALAQTREALAAAEQAQTADESDLAALADRVAQAEAQRQSRQDQVTAARVELAKSEERLANLRTRLRQLEQDQHERQRNLNEGRKQIELGRDRAGQAQSAMLEAGSQIAELFLRKEMAASETARHVQDREAHRAERATLVTEAQQTRATERKLEERRHARDLAAGEIRHERGALADRLREDYGIELAELEHAPTDEELSQREEIEREIGELRRKINHIGSVNLDALLELDELEARFGRLSAQFQDLTKAKESLSQIITKINADSRRLFAETLEIVKGHFQTLFRKLFGGGHADIVLDDGVDILDSGIEIVARPPGKEPRNISLLSGGEKTLTCVALLLAIFQYRPSPFCVLDEVDASLDEANIERFITVLQEFLAWTQFIVVTHSKKTMTCASTLYGVTMEESGISKRVSVRFEDVSEDGHVRLPDSTGDETQAA